MMKKLFCLVLMALLLMSCVSAIAEEKIVAGCGLYSADISVMFHEAGDITVRQIIEVNITGDAISLEFSNRWGTEPLTLEQVTFAAANDKEQAGFDPETLVQITFDGNPSVTIEAGAAVTSDRIPCPVEAGKWYAVSAYVQDGSKIHSGTTLSTYGHVISYTGAGNLTETADAELIRNMSNPTLRTVNVYTQDENARCIVVVGDSTSSNSWPTLFQHRLQEAGIENVCVIYRTTSGNRLMADGDIWFGESVLNRFDHDVFDTNGVSAILFKVGVNDIFQPNHTPGLPIFTLEEMTAAEQTIIDKAHGNSLPIYMMTITPFHGYITGRGDSAEESWDENEEAVRVGWNEWLMNNNTLDGVIDLCPLLTDPEDSTRHIAEYSLDNLHPNDAGCQIIADAVPVEWFK